MILSTHRFCSARQRRGNPHASYDNLQFYGYSLLQPVSHSRRYCRNSVSCCYPVSGMPCFKFICASRMPVHCLGCSLCAASTISCCRKCLPFLQCLVTVWLAQGNFLHPVSEQRNYIQELRRTVLLSFDKWHVMTRVASLDIKGSCWEVVIPSRWV